MTVDSTPDLLLLASTVQGQTDVTTRLASLRDICRGAGMTVAVDDYRTWFGGRRSPGARHVHLIDPVSASEALAGLPAKSVRVIRETLENSSFSVSVTRWPGGTFALPAGFVGECLRELLDAACRILVPPGRAAAFASAAPAWRDRLWGIMPPALPLPAQGEGVKQAEKLAAHILGPRDRLLLFGGRIERAAHLERFARVTARLRAYIPELRAVMVGPLTDAGYAASIFPLLRESGCIYAGAWDRSAMRVWIGRAAVVWHPGDGLEPSLIVLEALGMGRPALVSPGAAAAWPQALGVLGPAASDAQAEEQLARLLPAGERRTDPAATSAFLHLCAADRKRFIASVANTQPAPPGLRLTPLGAMG